MNIFSKEADIILEFIEFKIFKYKEKLQRVMGNNSKIILHTKLISDYLICKILSV